jgi:hypothetical protein
VLRLYCGTNTSAWADQVIAIDHFRRPKSASIVEDSACLKTDE